MLSPVRAVCALLVLSGCGNVVFVDPDAALKAKLQLGGVERLVVKDDPRGYFHVRIRSREGIDRVRLMASGASGFFELPLDQAHRQSCGDRETCLSLTLPPGLPEDLDQMVLSVPEIGHETTGDVVIRRLEAHALYAEAMAQNTALEVTIVDPIRRFYTEAEDVKRIDEDGNEEIIGTALLFPRSFEVWTGPGACGGDISGAEEAWAPVEESPFMAAATFSEGPDPLACARIRPALPGGGAAVAATTVTARAEVVSFRHMYRPPVESSPLVFLPMFDLELPNAERCSEAQNLVQSALIEAATDIASSNGDGAEVLALPALQIAVDDGVPCRQRNDRLFSPASLVQDIQAAVADAFGPDRKVRVMLVYAANLDLAMPPSLEASFTGLRIGDEIGNASVELFLFAIAPERAIASLQANRQIGWVATEEPSFRTTITDVLGNIWPFRTTIHTDRTVVPLVEEEDRDRFELYRICMNSVTALPVTPLGATVEPAAGILRPEPEGPAYRVRLSEQVLVERSMFITPTVVVEWQGCERLCDRPAPGGDPRIPWRKTPGCT